MKTILAAFAVWVGLVELGMAQSERDPMWKYPPQMPGGVAQTYKEVGETRLQIWQFSPADHRPTDSRPAIVFFFGGGWRAGTPGQFYHHCQYLASRGMVAFTADYRVLNRHQVLAPECLKDAKSAIRWVRSHAAQLGVDPQRIVAAGGSAGGHLAACTAIVSGFDDPQDNLQIRSTPDALALFNPAVLLAPIPGPQQIDPEKLASIAERTDHKSEELSPLLHIRGDLPPTIIFHGTADEAVPFWTVERFTEEMLEAGNRCELKAYPGAPHGFFNTGRGGSAERQDLEQRRYRSTLAELDQFLRSLNYLQGEATVAGVANPNIRLRGDFRNSRAQFEVQKSGHVAFIGGSITEMNGYRPMVSKWLEQRFPEAALRFTNAGISSTCSTTGACRLTDDVFAHGQVDLLFVEFAVNDDQDAAHARAQCIRGMEGIVRQARKHNPQIDIVITHFVNPPMLETIQQGQQPLSLDCHETVARHYNVSSINLAAHVAAEIDADRLTWKQYGGTHPAPHGNQICADLIAEMLDTAWSIPAQPPTDKKLPSKPLDPYHYGRGRFIAVDQADYGPGWALGVPNWSELAGSKRSRFTQLKLLHSTTPGAKLSIPFEGSAVGVYVLAGPDAGILEYSIDGSDFQTADLFHRFSTGLHYPRTVMLADELPDKPHSLELRVSGKHHPDSQGTGIRILKFAAN